MNNNTINLLWRIADTLTVHQAASLIADVEPSAVHFNSNNCAWLEDKNGQVENERIAWVQIAFNALINAISVGTLPAKVVHDSRSVTDEDCQVLVDMHQVSDLDNGISMPNLDVLAGDNERVVSTYFVMNEPNWAKSLVSRTDLIAWLEGNNFHSGFFFPSANTQAPDYLDPDNPRYAAKLAAAVRAWQAVTNPGKKSPKQALEKWIRENAAVFKLTGDDGNPVAQAVEDCSKVANWQPGGGAPKTPVK